MNRKSVSSALLVAVGIGAAYWMYKSLQQGNEPATARGVSGFAKAGSLITTPIQLSKVAVVGLSTPLDWIGKIVRGAADAIPANLSNGSVAQDWRLPFGNLESANAAATADKETNVSNYRPSSWAPITFRTGV